MILIGILGLIRSGVAGDGRAARIGGPLAAGGTALLFVAELLSLLVIDTAESAGSASAVGAVFGLATILATVGMLVLGVATLREGRWEDWRRFTPLLCGLVVLLLVPIQLTSALWLGVGVYGLCFAALGVALLREASPGAPAAVPARVGADRRAGARRRRWVHLVIAAAIVAGVFAQVYLIGAYVFGAGTGALDAHESVGWIVHSLELLVALLAIVAWMPRRRHRPLHRAGGRRHGAGRPRTGDEHGLGALHPLGALIVLIGAAMLVRGDLRLASDASSTSDRPPSRTPAPSRALSRLPGRPAVSISTDHGPGALRGGDVGDEAAPTRRSQGGAPAPPARPTAIARAYPAAHPPEGSRMAVEAIPRDIVAVAVTGRAAAWLGAERRTPATLRHEVREWCLERPVEPARRVVLAVGVVVAALGAAELVAAEQQRHALGQQQRRQQVARLPRAQRQDAGSSVGPRRRSSSCGCRRCRRGCPRRWPRCACVVADEVGQGEAVVDGHEVDRPRRRPPSP